MSVEHTFHCTFHCEGPDCERHIIVLTQQPRPTVFLTVYDFPAEQHFCGWDCLLRFAAGKEPEQSVPAEES